jgi:hypothetical protein
MSLPSPVRGRGNGRAEIDETPVETGTPKLGSPVPEVVKAALSLDEIAMKTGETTHDPRMT